MEKYTSQLLPFGCRLVRSFLRQGERTNQSDIQGGSLDGDGSDEDNPL